MLPSTRWGKSKKALGEDIARRLAAGVPAGVAT